VYINAIVIEKKRILLL